MVASKIGYGVGAVVVVGVLAATVGWVGSPAPAGAQGQTPVAAAGQDRPRAERGEGAEPAEPAAQLERARKELREREEALEVAELKNSEKLVEARFRLMELEEKVRQFERGREVELDALHRKLGRGGGDGPEVEDLKKRVAALTVGIREAEIRGDVKPVEVERSKKLLDVLRTTLMEAEAKTAEESRHTRSTLLRLEQDVAGRLLALRREILVAEEAVRRLERRAAHEAARATAAVEAADARVRQLEGLPAAQERPGRTGAEAERKLDEVLRELADLKRELKRPR